MDADRGPGRLRRHGRPEFSDDAGTDPLPPYQVSGVEMVYLEGRLDGVPDLPAGLVQAPGHSCMIALYKAASGWGIAPFDVTYARIALDGLNSPDRSEAMFHLGGMASGLGGRIFRRDYNRGFADGRTKVILADRHVTATGGFGAGGVVEFVGCFANDVITATAGAHSEFAENESGGLVEWLAAYDTKYRELRVERFEINLPEGHPLAYLARFRLEAAVWLFDKSFTMSPPRPVDLADFGPVKQAFLALVERLHARFALINPAGQVGHASVGLRGLFGSDAAVKVAFGSVWERRLAEPFVVETMQGPGLIRLLPVSADLWPGGARLATLTLPGERSSAEPEMQLRLLGLTPSEARIVLAAANGLTARLAAERLGLTPHTIRSTLKTVYDKLGIGRRSELAAMVARM